MTTRITDDMYLFWEEESCFSNFYKCEVPLPINGTFVNFSETLFMYYKAKHFGDDITAEAILKTKAPLDAKRLGRQIRPYDEEEWERVRVEYMLKACLWKFSHNPKALEILLNTGKRTLVEASPFDKIWGIGLAPLEPKALDKSQWKGRNLLGEVLMMVRYWYHNPHIDVRTLFKEIEL